jgi:glycosyltransferase involved in cell wall biosynthesis
MRVLAVVPYLYDTSPGQRFRIEQWEPILRAGGVEITYAPFESEELGKILYKKGQVPAKLREVVSNLNRRRQDVKSAASYDLVYVFREAALLGPPWFERGMARSGVPMIFDFDDAIFVRYKSPANGYLSYLKFPGKTAEICRRSTHVMAGNEYLANYARAHNKEVTIVPTTIDTDKYAPVEKAGEPDLLTIGWSGSFSTVQHLDTIRDTLQELAKTERFRLRVIGTPEYDLPGVDVEAIQWRAETELADLAAIDIGLMPLPDDNWSRGKCGLKALQYMALGIPTICSPVGVNSTIIQDSENGLLARDPSEWVAKLKLLLHSPELRRKLGEAGRQTVAKSYSAEVIAPKVLEIFRSASASDQKTEWKNSTYS